MKKRYLLPLVVILLTSFKLDASALDAACTQAEQVRLRQIATAITFQYKLVDYDMGKGFEVSILGFTKDLYATVKDTNIYFAYQEGTNVATDVGFMPGEKDTLDIYASDATKCSGMKITAQYINVPYYNYYSELPVCKGIERYYMCQKYADIHSLVNTTEAFILRVEAYKKSLEDKPNEEEQVKPEEKPKSFIDNVLDFIEVYYMYFLVTTIVVGTTGIVIIEVRKRRSIL